MKSIFVLLALLLTTIATAQQLPQFAYNSFDDWQYNNPNLPLNEDNIGNGKIALYIDSQGRVLTLTSPEFPCQGIDSIQATIGWHTPNFSTSSFDLDRATLTITIDAPDGTPIDSITLSTPKKARNHTLHASMPMPQGLTTARLRFVSWTGDVNSFGAVRSIALTAATASPQQVLHGDVNGDGQIAIGDVTALIDYLLSSSSPINAANADVNGDGSIAIGDVTALIDILLNKN